MNVLIHHFISDILKPDQPLIMTLEACQEVIKGAARQEPKKIEKNPKILFLNVWIIS
jgi:hypothetical protein